MKSISLAGCDCITDCGILALVSLGGGEDALYQASYGDSGVGNAGPGGEDPSAGRAAAAMAAGVTVGDASTISWIHSAGVRARTVTVGRPALPPSALLRICVSGCYHVGDVGIGYVATRCSLLREIVVDGCPDITDAGILELARRCNQLRRVSVRGLYNSPSPAHAFFYSPERATAARTRKKHESRKAKEDATFEACATVQRRGMCNAREYSTSVSF